MKKRWLSLVLVLCMIWTILPVQSFALDPDAILKILKGGYNNQVVVNTDATSPFHFETPDPFLDTAWGDDEYSTTYYITNNSSSAATEFGYYLYDDEGTIVKKESVQGENGLPAQISPGETASRFICFYAIEPEGYIHPRTIQLGQKLYWRVYAILENTQYLSEEQSFEVSLEGSRFKDAFSDDPILEVDPSVLKWAVMSNDQMMIVTSCDKTAAGKLVIPEEYNGKPVGYIDDEAFSSCSGLKIVQLPSSLKRIGDKAFSYCASLTYMIIPNSVKRIEHSAFYNCESLESVTLGDGLTEIGRYAFAKCSSLKSITIPSGLAKIEESVFMDCNNMTSVTLDLSVTKIGDYAFARCDRITDVYYNGSREMWNLIEIGRGNSPLLNATIHFNSSGPSDITPAASIGTPVASQTDITFRYNISETSEQGMWSLPYADTYLSGNATTFRSDLAKISLGLTMASTNQVYQGANVGSSYIQEMLENMGFDKDALHFSPDYADTQSEADRCKYTFAVKKLANSEDYVVAVVIRSNGYGGEWVSNAHVNDGDPNYSAGFNRAAEDVYENLSNYLKSLPIEQSQIKLWVTGFSRGGAIANLLGAKLTERSEIDANRIFVYGFAVPRNVQGSIAVPYSNIFNIINQCDMVPRVPLQAWGFERYGINKYLPCESKNARGYRALRTNMETYFDHMMSCSLLSSTKYALIPAQERALDLLLAYLTDVIPSKESYRNDGYQNTVMQACRAWQINGEEISPEYVLQEIFGLSPNCASGLLRIFENWSNDSAAERAKNIIAAEVLLNDWADENGSEQAQKMRNMVLDLLGHVALYTSLNTIPPVMSYSMSKSKQYIELASMIADVIQCGKDGRAFGSALLMQHWPETYLSWMMAGDADKVFTEGTYTTLFVKCPVDITVYDEHNTVVASIVNDVVDESIDGLYCETDSFGEKRIILPADETFRTVITAREPGALDIVEQKCDGDDQVIDTNCYIQLPMKEDQVFDVAVADTCTVTTEGAVLTPDEILDTENRAVEIHVDVLGGGSVTGAKMYNLGETATLMAAPDAQHSFVGWYEGDSLLSTEEVLHFTAVCDRTITARFEEASICDSGTCGPNLTWTLDSHGLLTISGTGPMTDYDYYFNESNSPFYNIRNNIKRVQGEHGVTSIGDHAFYKCSGLTSISIPDSVTSIGEYAFRECSSLTSISIPDSVTGIEYGAFSNCSSLTSISIPDSVTSIGNHAFSYCSSLTSISIPDSLTRIAYATFYDCSSLMSISIPDSVTSIGEHAFSNCSSLSSISIPDGVTEIGSRAFFNCSSLTSISIPDSVTGIPASAFSGCSSLSSISIPSSVTRIGAFAFANCDKLNDVYFSGTQDEWNAISIDDNNDSLLNAQIHFVPSSPFTDVPDGKYYTDAVLWAFNHDPQITTGVTDTTFMPDRTCTRAHVVTFLWRANGCPEPTSTVNSFKDVPNGKYYTKAVLWAAEQGVTTGYADGTFRPEADCTRAQVVTFLWRANGSPNPTSSSNPFTDVPAGKYYAKAVLWALETGVTTGKTPTTFNPDGECTRAHVVTFLYRDMA